MLGLTFKENCPDLRNSRVPDIIGELRSYGIEVAVHDPGADAVDAADEYDVALTAWDDLPPADAIVIAVSHREYATLGVDAYRARLRGAGVIADVKGVLSAELAAGAASVYWRL